MNIRPSAYWGVYCVTSPKMLLNKRQYYIIDNKHGFLRSFDFFSEASMAPRILKI